MVLAGVRTDLITNLTVHLPFIQFKTKIMKTVKLILTYLFGAFMVYGGINHFLKPEMYYPFFPDFLPKAALNYLVGVLEIVVGVAVFIPRFRALGTLAILWMMLAFLPLHIVDVFSENPAVGTHQIALIRLPVQFVFILWAWFIHRKAAPNSAVPS
jgi:uncharacterized membrane protein